MRIKYLELEKGKDNIVTHIPPRGNRKTDLLAIAVKKGIAIFSNSELEIVHNWKVEDKIQKLLYVEYTFQREELAEELGVLISDHTDSLKIWSLKDYRLILELNNKWQIKNCVAINEFGIVFMNENSYFVWDFSKLEQTALEIKSMQKNVKKIIDEYQEKNIKLIEPIKDINSVFICTKESLKIFNLLTRQIDFKINIEFKEYAAAMKYHEENKILTIYSHSVVKLFKIQETKISILKEIEVKGVRCTQFTKDNIFITGGWIVSFWKIDDLSNQEELSAIIPKCLTIDELKYIPQDEKSEDMLFVRNNQALFYGEYYMINPKNFTIKRFLQMASLTRVEIDETLYLLGHYADYIISYDCNNWERREIVRHSSEVTTTTLIDNLKLLVFGDISSCVVGWDLRKNTKVFTFTKHLHPITQIQTLNYGVRNFIISSDQDGVIMIYDSQGHYIDEITNKNNLIFKHFEILKKDADYYIVRYFETEINLQLIFTTKTYKTLKGEFMNYLVKEFNY